MSSALLSQENQEAELGNVDEETVNFNAEPGKVADEENRIFRC